MSSSMGAPVSAAAVVTSPEGSSAMAGLGRSGVRSASGSAEEIISEKTLSKSPANSLAISVGASAVGFSGPIFGCLWAWTPVLFGAHIGECPGSQLTEVLKEIIIFIGIEDGFNFIFDCFGGDLLGVVEEGLFVELEFQLVADGGGDLFKVFAHEIGD